MENCLAAAPDDPFRGHDGPLVLERGPATNPLFEAFFEAVAGGRATRSPTTSTGTARRASPPFDRNIHRGRRLSRGAGVPPPGDERARTSRSRTRTFVTRILFEGTRAVGVEYSRGRRRHEADRRAAR